MSAGRILRIGALVAAVAGAAAAGAQTPTLLPSAMPDGRRSGYLDMGPQTQAMQADDASNPAMLFVLDGEALWEAAPRTGKPSCAGCHGATSAMAGVASHYPTIDAAGTPLDLAGRIDQCRSERQGEPAWPRESRELLALTALVGLQSRGQPIKPHPGAAMDALRGQGEALFTRRQGQLDLSCADCHDTHAGARLAGAPIPQAHPTGYPLYRLEWQALGSLQRRLRACMTGVRAEPYALGSREFIALEAFLMKRAAGMPVETPAVRP